MSILYNENRPDDTPKTSVMDWQERLCNILEDEWNRGSDYVEPLNDMYEDIYKMIRGERPEKTYDWQSNVVINKTFQVVWTAIPYFMQKIFGAKPMIGVKSADKKGAWQREEILEFWNMMQPASSSKHVAAFLVWVMMLLRASLNGVGIKKKTWHQKLKRRSYEAMVPVGYDEDGTIRTEPHTRTTTIPVEDWPYDEVVNNADVRFDWLLQPGQSIRQGRFAIHRVMTDLDELQGSSINYFNLGEINPNQNTTDSKLRQDHSQTTGVDRMETPPDSDIYADVEIYERVGKFPVYKNKTRKIDGKTIKMPCFDRDEIYSSDDVEMRWMVATFAKNEENNVLIRFEPSRYEEINYIDMHLYLDAERWQSVGMIEPSKDILTAMNDNINAAFDEIWQNLFTPVVVDKYRLWDWDTMQYAPGQKWLVGGDPNTALAWRQPTNITQDAWQKHLLLDNEVQLMSAITPPFQGMGKEKAATTNVLNAQMSAGKLDFLVRMIEYTGLIPSAQMNVRFAKKFAHRMTFQMILGEPFEYGDYEEIYRYVPAAASVKLEYQKEQEILQDTQLMQVIANIPNPGVPKIINMLLQNIFRNRNWPEAAALLDESFYEPTSDAGNMQMLDRMLGGAPSNQNQLPMTTPEKSVRRLTYQPRGT